MFALELLAFWSDQNVILNDSTEWQRSLTDSTGVHDPIMYTIWQRIRCAAEQTSSANTSDSKLMKNPKNPNLNFLIKPERPEKSPILSPRYTLVCPEFYGPFYPDSSASFYPRFYSLFYGPKYCHVRPCQEIGRRRRVAESTRRRICRRNSVQDTPNFPTCLHWNYSHSDPIRMWY
jgi:hypothetical protein